jgi:hypothetical protein
MAEAWRHPLCNDAQHRLVGSSAFGDLLERSRAAASPVPLFTEFAPRPHIRSPFRGGSRRHSEDHLP